MKRLKLPYWRSLLFVPANKPRFVSKAIEVCADACILDLEDGVATQAKTGARDALANACHVLAKSGVDSLVRINTSELVTKYCQLDIKAALAANATGLVLPKVNTPAAISAVVEFLDTLGAGGEFVLLAQIEDVAALPNLDAIANASPRLVGMSLGTEDFSASAGMRPRPELLFGPSQQIVFACRRAGIQPFGFPASIADFADEMMLNQKIELARDMGFVGAMCIHPKQVGILNAVMLPSDEEVATAKAILDGWREAQACGQAVFLYAGKMVDLPVVKRAEQLVRRSRQC